MPKERPSAYRSFKEHRINGGISKVSPITSSKNGNVKKITGENNISMRKGKNARYEADTNTIYFDCE